MKLELILLLMFNLCISSCDKNDDNKDFGYPDGMSIGDMESTNDCTLEECSDERIVRLLAKEVKGKVFHGINTGRYGLSYPFSFDSSIRFYFCDLPEEFKEEDLLVSFDGEILDACGVVEAVWPVEEVYLIKLSKIEKQ